MDKRHVVIVGGGFAGACVAFGVGLFYADFLRIPGVIE